MHWGSVEEGKIKKNIFDIIRIKIDQFIYHFNGAFLFPTCYLVLSGLAWQFGVYF